MYSYVLYDKIEKSGFNAVSAYLVYFVIDSVSVLWILAVALALPVIQKWRSFLQERLTAMKKNPVKNQYCL